MPADTDSAKPFTDRHNAGKERLAALVQRWLPKTGLSQEKLNAIASWGLGQANALESSKISQLRNANVQKPSLRDLDALAALNRTIHCWQVEGPEAARERFGPPSSYGVLDEWLDEGRWIGDPRHPGQPLPFSAICDLFAGYLDLQQAATELNNLGQQMSDAFADMLDADLVRLNLGMREGLERLASCYPDQSDAERITKLRAVVLGDDTYSPSEFEAELLNLAETVRVLRGLPVDCYSPSDLRDELVAGLRRHG